MRDCTPRKNANSVQLLDARTLSPQVTFRDMPPDEMAVRVAHQRSSLLSLRCGHGRTHACLTIEPASADQPRWHAELRLSAYDGSRVVCAQGRSPHEAVDRAFDQLNTSTTAAA